MEAVVLIAWLFDIILGLGLLLLAWRLLSCSELFKAIVLFIAFGLLMAIAWVRMDAPDVALAEAAIGSGLTGALLLAALARLHLILSRNNPDWDLEQGLYPGAGTRALIKSFCMRMTVLLIMVLIAVGLGYSILSLAPLAPGLNPEVSANLANSGVKNPVTAVMLNFRGYDTLLEMIVLLIALLGVWSFGYESLRDKETAKPPVLTNLAHLLAPMLVIVAAYLLWVGADAPGGAFQAGSVLGAAGVLLFLMGWQMRIDLMKWPLRFVLVLGSSAFVVMAVLTLIFVGQMLEFPPDQAGALILTLEAFATLSIGATLVALFWMVDP